LSIENLIVHERQGDWWRSAVPARHGFDAPNLKIVKNGPNGGLELS
jgi:hypothetical protein